MMMVDGVYTFPPGAATFSAVEAAARDQIAWARSTPSSRADRIRTPSWTS
jgi:hypothetical protein